MCIKKHGLVFIIPASVDSDSSLSVRFGCGVDCAVPGARQTNIQACGQGRAVLADVSGHGVCGIQHMHFFVEQHVCFANIDC